MSLLGECFGCTKNWEGFLSKCLASETGLSWLMMQNADLALLIHEMDRFCKF